VDVQTVNQLRAWLAAGDTERVRREATKQVRADPKDTVGRLMRASANVKDKRVQDALRDLNRVVELDPDWAVAYYLRSVCYLTLSNNEKGDRQALFVRRSDVEIDHALLLEPSDETYQAWRKQLNYIMGIRSDGRSEGAAHKPAADSDLPSRIARVVGNFVGGAVFG
jgi:hypothetical protein